ncbi:4-(cytidine 5'-diphospho)-2-C-methyl-D-erythritol kinase [Bacillaceae bacterium S4-13-58]
MKIMEKAPAKINLGLDVKYKRDDGYHEVEMVMTTVDLADRIECTPLSQNKTKIVSQHRFVPNDEKNLAYQVAEVLKKRFNIHSGVEIKIDKQIPVAAGLAGGSSDAAATLRALNRLWQLNLSLDELAAIGAEIGSDVSFCVYGGTAIARGRGELIEHLPTPPSCWVVLAKPNLGVSTQTVYQQLKVKDIKHPEIDQIVQGIRTGNFERICDHVGNVLESVTLKLHPEVALIKKHMVIGGAEAVLMSGSGPTVFALSQYESRAERLYNSLRGFCEEVFVVRLLG